MMTRLLPVFSIVLLFGTSSVLAQDTDESAKAELARESVVIEPYTGPPIFLPKGEEPVPPQFVKNETATDYYDEAKTQPKVERQIAIYSDGSIKNAGPFREFYVDGQVFVEGQFADGEATGEWTYYHPNGNLAKKVKFVTGEPDGPVEVLREDGTIDAQREYSAGKRNGTWKSYDDTGENLRSEEHYVDGKADGVWKTWFPNGKQWQENLFKNGQRDGVSREWDNLGELRAEVEFKEGKRHGKARLWTADGKLVEQVFEDDKLLSTKRDE